MAPILCCLRSHLNVLSICLDKRAEYFIIMEDDVSLVGNFEEKVRELICNWQNYPDIDYVSLSYLPGLRNGEMISSKLNFFQNSKNLFWGFEKLSFTIWGSQAYIIKRKSIEKIFSILNHDKISVLINECEILFTRIPKIANKGDEIIIDSLLPRFLNQGFVFPMFGVENFDSNINSNSISFDSKRLSDWMEYLKSIVGFNYHYYNPQL
jgi:GR25 family glycosyltransferase involved in LPS biosynthesis